MTRLILGFILLGMAIAIHLLGAWADYCNAWWTMATVMWSFFLGLLFGAAGLGLIANGAWSLLRGKQ